MANWLVLSQKRRHVGLGKPVPIQHALEFLGSTILYRDPALENGVHYVKATKHIMGIYPKGNNFTPGNNCMCKSVLSLNYNRGRV